MKTLTAADRNLVTVLLSGVVTNHASISSLAEKGLVHFGAALTNHGKEMAYMVLADRLPDQTPGLQEELLRAAAYARHGHIVPVEIDSPAWVNGPIAEGWHWIEGPAIENQAKNYSLFSLEIPRYLRKVYGAWTIFEFPGSMVIDGFDLNARRVCPVANRPVSA